MQDTSPETLIRRYTRSRLAGQPLQREPPNPPGDDHVLDAPSSGTSIVAATSDPGMNPDAVSHIFITSLIISSTTDSFSC